MTRLRLSEWRMRAADATVPDPNRQDFHHLGGA
jgi:hypothetical protein